jgi:hypothetical protein
MDGTDIGAVGVTEKQEGNEPLGFLEEMERCSIRGRQGEVYLGKRLLQHPTEQITLPTAEVAAAACTD